MAKPQTTHFLDLPLDDYTQRALQLRQRAFNDLIRTTGSKAIHWFDAAITTFYPPRAV